MNHPIGQWLGTVWWRWVCRDTGGTAVLGAAGLAGGVLGHAVTLAVAGGLVLVGGTSLVASSRPARLPRGGRWGRNSRLRLHWQDDRHLRLAKVPTAAIRTLR